MRISDWSSDVCSSDLVDQQLMDEMQAVSRTAGPVETLLVVDSLTGQDAVQVAQRFTEQVPLTGVVLTRLDGDARGGAAERKSVVSGKRVSVRVDLGGRRIIKKKKQTKKE